MSKEEKLIERLKSLPLDFTFSEACTILTRLGYEEKQKGKTSGSRLMFIRQKDNHKILLHKPHPGDIMKLYSVKDLLNSLKGNGDIK